MYELIDRPVAELPPFERAMLDRMRRWVHALTLAGAAPAPVETDGAFDSAMRLLDRASTDTLVFQRPCHSTVEETEAVVLGLWQLVRDDRLGAAFAAASGLVDTASVRPFVGTMIRAVATLSD
ncbi:hypothetical protein GCM10011380_27290 [Sphingomonas metalli]|uniref:Uncharacterized protein n=1 Tax=Sphingomonas metalli TaxID=1779358 RepID=A0A916T970_9SPHN|nr:hypothetical protein [Sphingomonas metalli]GGB36422.1 hypothetical protein GCM10011380_27290 [Sphingomonas metalli]